MYRMYNPHSGEHFYTASKAERDNLTLAGWLYEGIAWSAPSVSETPVHRLYNASAGDHHYTTSEEERDMLVNAGWKYEGIGWYSDDLQGEVLFRLYNPYARTGTHHYTKSEEEKGILVGLGWKDEQIGWYGLEQAPVDHDPDFRFNEDGSVSYIEEGAAKTGEFTLGKTSFYANENGQIVRVNFGDMNYYRQGDPRWKDRSYGRYGTIEQTGCVPCSVVTMLDYLKGTSYTAEDMADELYALGYYNRRTDGSGRDTYRYIADEYGLDLRSYRDSANAIRDLKMGRMLVVEVQYDSYWCRLPGATHAILVYGYDETGRVEVFDPLRIERCGSFHLDTVLEDLDVTTKYGEPIWSFRAY